MANVRVVLIQPRNPLNIGAAARALANFGFVDLALVSPYGEAWRQARSARAGAAVLRRAECFATLADALHDRQYVVGTTAGTNRRPEMPLHDWRLIAQEWRERRRDTRCALLFGSEKTGLRIADIAHCHALARIETEPGAPSMNLGQAVAVCLYSLAASPTAAAASNTPIAASAEQLERVVTGLMPVLEAIGVFRPQHHPSQERRLRQMLQRWEATAGDARLLLGIAREMKRALNTCRASQTT